MPWEGAYATPLRKLRDFLEKELPLYIPGRYNDQCVLSLLDEVRPMEPREMLYMLLPLLSPLRLRDFQELPRTTRSETPIGGCLLKEEHRSILALAPPVSPNSKRFGLPVIK